MNRETIRLRTVAEIQRTDQLRGEFSAASKTAFWKEVIAGVIGGTSTYVIATLYPDGTLLPVILTFFEVGRQVGNGLTAQAAVERLTTQRKELFHQLKPSEAVSRQKQSAMIMRRRPRTQLPQTTNFEI